MSADPLDETDLTGSTTNAAFKEYIFFGGKRIARRDASGNVNYYLSDHLGSSRLVTNSAGTILDDCDFLPFGSERCYTSTSTNRYKFTGKERDAETQNDYFGARYYPNTLFRWLSPDEYTGGPTSAYGPADPASPGPLPYADIRNPQSLNKYVYVYNNPLKYIDPTGHTCWKAMFGWSCADDPPPPPPLPPVKMSPEAFKAFLISLRSQKVNTLTVGQVGNIVYNESGSLRPGKAGAAELVKGRIATANAVMNGDVALGASRPGTAPATVSAAAMKTQQFQQSQEASGQAHYDRAGGTDTAGGRMYFGNSQEQLHSRPIGDSRQTVYEHFGPFDPHDTFIYIYNDPGD